MEPRVQFATTSDDVSIAFWTVGQGPPLVHLGGWPFEHIAREWQQADYRLLYEHLAEYFTLVRFDGRGSGLSQREAVELSLAGRLRDIEAVVERLGLESFALVGFSTSGPAAIAYTVDHPEKVSRLILYDAHADSAALINTPQMRAFDAMLRANWELFTEMLSNVGYGWTVGDPARRFAAFLRECVTQQSALDAFEHMRTLDVTPLLPRVAVPTLVLQHTGLPYDGTGVARSLAAAIPGASLSMLDGAYGRQLAELHPILEFLGVEHQVRSNANGSVTILFTDMHDSTGLTQRIGDVAAHEVLRTHNSVVREALVAHLGYEIKHTGDGIMASFASATRALDCAIAVQQALARYNEAATLPIRVRIGINTGEPVAEEDDLFGSAVQLAARVCSHAEPDQILASEVVRQLAAGKPFLFGDIGEIELRGFEDPVRLYEVRWRD